jgi:predicted nucleic acid-binding Zn ribbon protein
MNHYRRRPRYYDGTGSTTVRINELLPLVLREVNRAHGAGGDLIMSAWNDIVGERIASMTQVVSFADGILSVIVRNSTLLSLLKLHERSKILSRLQKKFPETVIKNIYFRMG